MIGVRTAVDSNDWAIERAAAIFARYGDFIRRVISFQAGGRLDDEDLYQEFYLVLIEKPIPTDVQNIEGYLYRAVMHHVINAARIEQVYARAIEKYLEEGRISINRSGSESAFTEDEKNTAVSRLVHLLPEREGQALALRYRDDCSILEIAKRMGINKRTVSRYLSAGLRRLQQLRRRLAAE
ncbi:MAG: sigma-70 family RNA polymerase sigma factor [Phycisphaerae bacterium]|nr:sigma-70 family RNA polymerase sigma factor [Phycisphaerae bacterium]